MLETFVSPPVTGCSIQLQNDIRDRLAEAKQTGAFAYYVPLPYDRVIIAHVPVYAFPTKITLNLDEPQWQHLN